MKRWSHLALVILLAATLSACIEGSPNPVVFDQVLESTTFQNRLLTPIVIYRDDAVLDTLSARSVAAYELNRKGAVRHAFKIIAPLDNSGQPAGIQPYEDLGVQYRVRAQYIIDDGSISGRRLFTPRIGNYTPHYLRITANYGTSEQFSTNYFIGPNSMTSTDHAAYYYWLSDSNVLLSSSVGGRTYIISREDTTSLGTLELDPSGAYAGSGATRPISIY